MGISSFSKFKKYLQHGDEYAAIQVFLNSLEMQNNLDPNSSYGDSLQHFTPLHLASKHAMKSLLRLFLYQLKGNPNKRNAMGETALHLLCQGDCITNITNQEKRALLTTLVLQWKSESEETADLTIVDCEGNTALHYAAATGLKKCVEILLSYGAPLFIENKSSETACDLAEKNKHYDIAQLLEFKMLFHSDSSDGTQQITAIDITDETASGLRAQDLQEAKDQLLVETSDMFHVNLFTAEVLLRNHEWSRQSLLDSWMKDPITCCKEAGVSPPTSALHFSTSEDSLKMCCEQIQNEYQNETLNSPARTVTFREEAMCDICTMSIHDEDFIQILCEHQFCKPCWKVYLTAKIVDGEAHNILCPAFDCPHIVPIDVIEKLVSADMVKRYIQFDIKAFVESNPTMKWCPYPSCARAVKLPDFETINEEILALSYNTLPSLSHSVDCGNGHYFCWECLGEAHAPCGCEKWQEWHQKISEIKPQELKNTYTETEEAENCLWMVTNSKPCPNCKCPIQKNEGCNHMKCSKCKFDYCWVCLESWKKHSPATGGYFRCNRHDAVQMAEKKSDSLITQAEAHNKHMQELKRFVQYYTRFKNHENGYKFEEPFIHSTQEKVSLISSSFNDLLTAETNLEFLEDSINELLRARRILCGSYVYGFYLEDNGYNKTIFEYLQNELEEATEKLSDAIIRSYLQTPQAKIMKLTCNVKRSRTELITAVLKGLIPPETPPSVRKSRRRRLPGLMGMDPVDDPMLSQAILESLENFNPNDPWLKDAQGKHTNVAAVCDWPDYDSDEEDLNAALSSELGICSRVGCNRSRVRNCRTGEMHDYCSLYCKHWEVMESARYDPVVAQIDPTMDMLIALELSKLQTVGNPNIETSDSKENLRYQETMEKNQALLEEGENKSGKLLAAGGELELFPLPDSTTVLNISTSDGDVSVMKDNVLAVTENISAAIENISDDMENAYAATKTTCEAKDNISDTVNNVYEAKDTVSDIVENVSEDKENISDTVEYVYEENDNISDIVENFSEDRENILGDKGNISAAKEIVQAAKNAEKFDLDESDTNFNVENECPNDLTNFENIDSIPNLFNTGSHETTINFFLKDTCDEEDFIPKNLNVTSSVNNNKAEKQLFQILKDTTDTNTDSHNNTSDN